MQCSDWFTVDLFIDAKKRQKKEGESRRLLGKNARRTLSLSSESMRMS